jgi:hypothetical protein
MGKRIFYRMRKYKRSPALMAAIEKAGELSGAPKHRWHSAGKAHIAKALKINVQSINNWFDIPRDRIYAVHQLTKIPLSKLAPDLFKDPR